MRFDCQPLAIVPVEFERETIGLRGIVGGKQARTEVAAPDASAGIDARTENEAQMKGRKRRRGGSEPRQSGEARPFEPFELAQALAHKGAVDAGKRHHIGDRGERDEIELVEKVRLVDPVAFEPALSTQGSLHRDKKQECEPRGADIGDARAIVGPVRIHMGEGRRICLHGVVIEHDRVQAAVAGRFHRVMGGRAAIDGDEQAGAPFPQGADAGGGRAVAFGQPVRHVKKRLALHPMQEPEQQRRRTGAIDIVIAEDGDGLASLHRLGKPQRGALHMRKRTGIGKQMPQTGFEERVHGILGHAARGQEPRKGRAVAREFESACRVFVTVAHAPGARREGRIHPQGEGFAVPHSVRRSNPLHQCFSRHREDDAS